MKNEVCTIDLNGTIIQSKTSMKALRIILDTNLKWEEHVAHASKQCDRMNMGFCLLKKFFNKTELLQLATSMYYSKLYYASEVWLWPNCPTKILKTLRATSAKILKTITGLKCDQNDRMMVFRLSNYMRWLAVQLQT